MMNEICVLENCLPNAECQRLLEFTEKVPLAYGSLSNSETDPHGHWMNDFVSAGKHNRADISSILYNSNEYGPLHAAWTILKEKLPNQPVLIRCYVNGYTFGTDGYFHTDSRRPGDITAIIYLTNDWDPDWAGETVFIDTQDNICKSVLPRKNRAVIFPANVRHAARAVSRKCPALRRTLIFKTRARESEAYERVSSFLVSRGARLVGHKQGSLHDHLLRTFLLLNEHGCPVHICTAGSLHSVFGTSSFSQRLIPDTEENAVSDEFGAEVAHLVKLFSSIKRPSAFSRALTIGDGSLAVELRTGGQMQLEKMTYDALALIECANLLDQGSLAQNKDLQKLWYYTHPCRK